MRCEKPIAAIRWWKWLASADHGARLYLSRLAITKPVSRKGIARIASGTTNATNALVFSDPTTAVTPSRYPSRLAPASPMNTDAGW